MIDTQNNNNVIVCLQTPLFMTKTLISEEEKTKQVDELLQKAKNYMYLLKNMTMN